MCILSTGSIYFVIFIFFTLLLQKKEKQWKGVMAFTRALCFSTCAGCSCTYKRCWIHSEKGRGGSWIYSSASAALSTSLGSEASNLLLTLILTACCKLSGWDAEMSMFPPWEESGKQWGHNRQAWLEERVSYVSIEKPMNPRHARPLCLSASKSMQARHVVGLWPNNLWNMHPQQSKHSLWCSRVFLPNCWSVSNVQEL